MAQNTGNQEPFVTRFEMAVMQYVILSKAQQGEVTRENLKQTFRGNLQMTSDHFDHCITLLTGDGHLKESNGKFTITDDGREDIQKLQTLVMEIPNVVKQGQGQGQPRSAIPQQQTTGQGGVVGTGQQGAGNVNKGQQSGGNVGSGQQGGSQQGSGQNKPQNR